MDSPHYSHCHGLHNASYTHLAIRPDALNWMHGTDQVLSSQRRSGLIHAVESGCGVLSLARACRTSLVLAPAETATVGFVFDDGQQKFELPSRVYPPPRDSGSWTSSGPAVALIGPGRISAQTPGATFVAVQVIGQRDSATVRVISTVGEKSDYSMISAGLSHTCSLTVSGAGRRWSRCIRHTVGRAGI